MEPNITRNDDVNFSVDRGTEHETWRGMFDNLVSDTKQLYERESQLVRQEVSEKITEAKNAIGAMLVGGTLLLLGLFALVATAIIVLDNFLPLWGSAALVTAVLLLVGLTLLFVAKKKVAAERMKPHHSLEALGEIRNSFQERFNEFKQHH